MTAAPQIGQTVIGTTRSGRHHVGTVTRVQVSPYTTIVDVQDDTGYTLVFDLTCLATA